MTTNTSTRIRICIHGPIAAKIGWAFTSSHANNWHPLTWLSHILDYQLYGLHAGGHHSTNVLLHAATAILLFLVLRRMTGDLWPSAFVAAIFAIHPLRVESVAWVAERKDVLSGLFFMLTLWAYLGYVRRPFSLVRYLAVMALFALGLMAKPMLVTLPFVLAAVGLLAAGTDGYKAATVGRAKWRDGLISVCPKARPPVAALWANAWSLVREKIPLFVLAAASCVATTLAQRRAIVPVDAIAAFGADFQRPGFLCGLSGPVLLSGGIGGTLSAPGPGLPLWKPIAALLALTAISDRRAGMATAAPCCVGRLVLVSGDAGAGDRPGSGGRCRRWPTAIPTCRRSGCASRWPGGIPSGRRPGPIAAGRAAPVRRCCWRF